MGPGLDDWVLARELEAGPPWVPVTDTEPAGLVAAYLRARARARQVAVTLAAVGFDPGRVPDLCGGLDWAGNPVVEIGVLDDATARDLVQALITGLPHPGRAA